ncbi:peptidase T [Fructilactobacillus sp. Tb1]|uniref:peptidase T n=1 Tax=Fructilactobacillus sp. Tb1 TaxID=3422304 RepID=UPI003D2C69C1
MTKYPSLLSNFLDYVKINTRSDANKTATPTTPGQTILLKKLAEQLKSKQLKDVHFSDGSFVFGTIPANTDSDLTIGLIAHVDTADFNSDNVNPQVHPNYAGNDIQLNSEFILSPNDFPHLKNYLGNTLITTDGTTLLGADDKAGIAEIIALIDYLNEHPEIKHCEIKVAFGPDEEIGKGADAFNVTDFGADIAYTLDTGAVGEINAETFNAAEAIVTIKGTSVHPSTAKGLMVSAITLANEFENQVPSHERPEFTEDREGFYFTTDWHATPDKAEIGYILRDFDKAEFMAKKQKFIEIAKSLNVKYGDGRVKVNFKDQYFNMAELIDDSVVQRAKSAIEQADIKPRIVPFRGGTDGSKITFKGLPTPNLTNGSENAHGQYEFASLESMEQTTDILLNLVKL